MLTRCPSCEAWFRVRAEHLSAANGFVTCGACEQVFNALSTLTEEAAAPPVLTAREAPPQNPPGALAPAAPASTPDAYEGSTAFVSEEPSTATLQPATPSVLGTAVEDDTAAPAFIATTLSDDADPGLAPKPERDPGAESRAAPDTDASRADEFPQQESPASAKRDAAENAPGSLLADTTEKEVASAPESTQPGDPPAGVQRRSTTLDDETLTEAGSESSITKEPDPVTSEVPRGQQLSAEEHAVLFEAPEYDGPPTDARIEDHEYGNSQAEPDLSAGTGPDTSAVAGSDQHTKPSRGAREMGAASSADNEAVPDVLREAYAALEQAQAPRPSRRSGWVIAATLLVAAIVVQLLLANRDAIEARYPGTLPWFERACRHLACEARQPEETASVHLLARDIRDHPQYLDALLVNATLVNEAATASPFPELQLTLHDATGATIGTRRFLPDEYLDDSIPVAPGMPPGQPVYVVMELGGAASSAVSFEFTFL